MPILPTPETTTFGPTKPNLETAMSVTTSKILTFIHDAGTSQVNSEVRSVALVWIVSLLGTALLAFIIYLLGIVPAWD
jgi:hypothetical protein